ncbi:MAG: TCR/Tet family MFS transporter [Xanthomonadales bacterium]|nr:TCR/Tet family MFS transporter [Xanthomonadales bacterium]MCE7931365.1 MFS transporter [Xanthomonadales bacterium PRO6]
MAYPAPPRALAIQPVTTPAAPRQAALIFIFVTVALDILAIGLIIPVLPPLIAGFYPDAAQGATVYGWFVTVFALMQFLASPLLGALSDRFGRRPVILLSNLGLGLDYILMAVAQTLPLLFLGRVIGGITSASIATANAYIADVTPPEKRAASFGMLGAAFGLGFVIGPAVGGLLGSLDVRLPFWVAAALSLLNFLYGLFVLPESLPAGRHHRFEWKRANPVGSLLWLRRFPQVFGLAGASFLSVLAHAVFPATFVLYAAHRYGWSERDIGFTLASVGVLSALVQGGLVRRVIPAIGERRALVVGFACAVLGFIGYGWAPSGPWFWAVMPLLALWGLAGPSLQSLMTRQIDPTEQGRLQGAVASLGAVAGVIGPYLFTRAYAAGIDPARGWNLPGAAFYLASLLVLGALAVGAMASRERA